MYAGNMMNELDFSFQETSMVLVDSNFLFRFRFIIQMLPLRSMDDKEPKIVLNKYYLSIFKKILSTKITRIS